MSYILEALKKADAAREREREAVPGLHSRHDHALPDDHDDRAAFASGTRTPWLVGGIGGGVVIAGALFWLLGRPGPDAPLASQSRPMPMSGQVAPLPLPTNLPPVAASAMAQAPAPLATPLPQGALPASTEPIRVAPREPTAVPPSVSNARVKPSEPDPLKVDASLRETGPAVVPMQDLPEDIRRELPPLTVGGAMHSDVAANRMLVLNGGVFREGDQPSPGVVLEEIRLKSAVLRYKGHRYSISY